jgi:superfamily II DNA or RNA helicase
MQERFINAGIAAGYIDGFTDKTEQDQTLRAFARGDIRVLWSVAKLIAGVDFDVGCIIDAAPTASEIRHVQKYGRARGQKRHLGDAEGRAIIIDHAGNTNELGFVTDIHHDQFVTGKPSEKADREKKERLPKPCKKCDYMIPVGVTVCPSCGTERALPPLMQTVEGDLQEVRKSPVTMADKQRFWSMALWLDDQRERKGKLALGLYKGRFGVWPRGLDDCTLPPDQAFYNYEKSRRIAFAKSKGVFKR